MFLPEVKTRRNMNFGSAIDAITISKQKHIWETAQYYLYKNNLLNVLVRFDVIEVYVSENEAHIFHTSGVSMNER